MQQQGLYTCTIAGQAVTLTPKAGSESKPTHLGATTIVFNTVAAAAPTEFWKTKDNYIVIIQHVTAQ